MASPGALKGTVPVRRKPRPEMDEEEGLETEEEINAMLKHLKINLNLKDELHKVMNGSQEMIDLAFRSTAADGDAGSFVARQRISYEELQRYIEQVLQARVLSRHLLPVDEAAAAQGSSVVASAALATVAVVVGTYEVMYFTFSTCAPQR